MDKIIYKKILKNRETPFYVFDKRGFIDNYHALENAMQEVYPNYRVSYSYKTNYTPYICKIVKNLGGYAEVVSDMEYTLAKKIGYSNNMIVYNGPAKGEYLEEHLLHNGIVNVDSVDEVKRIVEIAKKHYVHQFKVGIRINLDVGADFISRFGLELESEDLKQVILLINSCANVSLVGVHCHISRNRGIEAWKKRAKIMLEAADRYITGTPEYISLGSGMFADMEEYLKKQFSNVPTYEEYANATLQPFVEHYKHDLPIVFTEPGTTVIARYLNFVTKVLSLKKVRGRNMAVMDGSYLNLGEICTMKKLPITKLNSDTGDNFEVIDIMGYTCLEQDLMCGEYEGNLLTDDILVFGNVGGYSIVSKPQFIQPNCPMITVDEDGNILEIMRKENFDDVFSKFLF